MQTSVSTALLRLLKSQKYHLAGQHSAVKRCRWLYESLVHNRPCYKQKFYGIRSHQCVQMTPSVLYCNMRCRFCWRIQSGDVAFKWDETGPSRWDDPETIVEACIEAQTDILSGYKANPKVDKKTLREASTPRHAAISLTGEPTLYPRLGELIKSFHKRGFTTFLVSNGTLPDVLTQLDTEPTQLYVSLCAYDKQTFTKTCRPQIPNAWERLTKTLSLLSSFKCPTVIRLTLVRHVNLSHPEQYARLLSKAHPTYVEPKAYMHVGASQLRLSYENMPSHQEIRDFAVTVARETGYNLLDEAPESRVVLLSDLDQPLKLA